MVMFNSEKVGMIQGGSFNHIHGPCSQKTAHLQRLQGCTEGPQRASVQSSVWEQWLINISHDSWVCAPSSCWAPCKPWWETELWPWDYSQKRWEVPTHKVKLAEHMWRWSDMLKGIPKPRVRAGKWRKFSTVPVWHAGHQPMFPHLIVTNHMFHLAIWKLLWTRAEPL